MVGPSGSTTLGSIQAYSGVSVPYVDEIGLVILPQKLPYFYQWWSKQANFLKIFGPSLISVKIFIMQSFKLN